MFNNTRDRLRKPKLLRNKSVSNSELDDYEGFRPKKKESFRCKKSNNDLPSLFSDLFSNINIKVSIFLFILGLLIFSDVFLDSVLTSVPEATFGNEITSKGTIIQLTCLVIGYIIIDLLAKSCII